MLIISKIKTALDRFKDCHQLKRNAKENLDE